MIVFSRVRTPEKPGNLRAQKPSQETQTLLDEIRQSESAMSLAYMNFEHASEPALIDCSIYELNAAQLRYQYLLEKAKQSGLKDIHNHFPMIPTISE